MHQLHVHDKHHLARVRIMHPSMFPVPSRVNPIERHLMLQMGAIEMLRMKQKAIPIVSFPDWKTLLFVPLDLPVNLLVLFKEHEGRDRVWSQSDEARHPALEDPAHAFLGCDAGNEAHNALLGMRAHDASLDHVHRAADCGRNETGHDRGGEMRAEIVTKVGAL